MQGLGEDLLLAGVLHHVAQVHHAHRVGDVLHHRQIMADEQVRQVELLLQVLQQVDDLGLYGHIQGGHRLVADDEVRVQGDGAGDADALALAAGELVGIAVLLVVVQSAGLHDAGHIGVVLVLGHQAVLPHGLSDDFAHGQAGRQAGVGVLEDQLHLGSEFPQRLAVQLVQMDVAVEHHLAGGLGREVQKRLAHGGLAAAGLAHQAHGGAPPDGERHVLHRVHMAHHAAEQPGLDREVLAEVAHLHHVFIGGTHFPAPPS